MPIPSKERARQIISTIQAVDDMTGPATQRPRRRVRTGGSGGGSSLIYLTTDNTGLSFNDGAQYDRPGGTASAAGKGFFAITSGDVLYIQPSVMYS